MTPLPPHIGCNATGYLMCRVCGCVFGRDEDNDRAREFIEQHRECGKTTTAREGEE